MNKKLQVFVSSTYTDLIEERQAAVQAILDAGHIPAGMELFKAGKSQMKTIQKWIDESDVYMLILGGRYGSIEEESGLSYTELEYNYAISKNMPVFTVVLEDSFLFTKAASKNRNEIFEEKHIEQYEFFKKNVISNIVNFVNNIDQISSKIHSQLNYFINDSEYLLIGWVRGNSHPSSNFKIIENGFNNIIIGTNNNKEINANEHFLLFLNTFIHGLSKSKYPYDYEHSLIYLFNNFLIEKNSVDGKERLLILSELGYQYYNYLISKF